MDGGVIILLVLIAILLLGWLVYLTIAVNSSGVTGKVGPRGQPGPAGSVGSVTTTTTALVTGTPGSGQLQFSTLQTPSQASFTFVKGELLFESLGGTGTKTATIRIDTNYTATGTVTVPVVFEVINPFTSVLCSPSNLVSSYTVMLPLGTGAASYNVYPLLTGSALFSQTSLGASSAVTSAWAGLFIPSSGTSTTANYRLLIIVNLPTFTSGSYNLSSVLTGSWLCP